MSRSVVEFGTRGKSGTEADRTEVTAMRPSAHCAAGNMYGGVLAAPLCGRMPILSPTLL